MSCFLCHLVLGAVHGGLLFVVCGFWGLFCFGLPGFCCCGGWVGLCGLVFWTVVLTVALAFWLGFCWFCLESLILAQDERWRRA